MSVELIAVVLHFTVLFTVLVPYLVLGDEPTRPIYYH